MTAPSDQARAEMERVVELALPADAWSEPDAETGAIQHYWRAEMAENVVTALLDPSNRDKVLGAMGVEFEGYRTTKDGRALMVCLVPLEQA